MFHLIKLLLSPKTILGITLGGAAAYFSDPDRGADRRAQALKALKQRAPGAAATGTGTFTPASSTPEPSLWTPNDTPSAAAN